MDSKKGPRLKIISKLPLSYSYSICRLLNKHFPKVYAIAIFMGFSNRLKCRYLKHLNSITFIILSDQTVSLFTQLQTYRCLQKD